MKNIGIIRKNSYQSNSTQEDFSSCFISNELLAIFVLFHVKWPLSSCFTSIKD